MTVTVHRYAPADRAAWDRFVSASRNGTFLLERGFMDYHADRFEDHSFILREGDDIVALLPANRVDNVLHSHQGLTYGGLVVGARSGSAAMLGYVEALRERMADDGIARLVYKTIPWIYHRQPAEEDRYALFRHGAALVRRDVLSVAAAGARLKPQDRRSRGAKSAAKAGVVVRESMDFAPFWAVLDANLRERYGVGPVHSLDEIRLLHSRFPGSIRLFEGCLGGGVVAGAVVFETPTVAHVQYISADAAGKQNHALDLLFMTLLHETYRDKPYFDFGISNEEDGLVLNEGLVAQKEGFGARSVVHDYYELRVVG